MDMMLDGNYSSSIETKMKIVLNHSLGQGDTEAILTYKIPSQHIGTRNIGCKTNTSRSDRTLIVHGNVIRGIESQVILSEGFTHEHPTSPDKLNKSILPSMIVIPGIQHAMGTLSSGQRDTESGSSNNNQDDSAGTTRFKTKITKKDSRSAFDLGDTEDLSPYTNTK